MVKELPELAATRTHEEGVVHSGKRFFYRTYIHRGGSLNIATDILARYGITKGDNLLVVRGSGLALGFIIRGPIVDEALKHPELEVY